MNLLLIRHGTTDWVGKRLAGWLPGIHLNQQGQVEAEALARLLEGLPVAALYSSPLERALETARPAAGALGLPVEVREGLGEVRCGDWAGRSLDELRLEGLWTAVQTCPSEVRFPGGESLLEAQNRMVAEIDALRRVHPGQVVAAFSHADPIKAAVAHYAGIPLDLFQRLVVQPGSVTSLSLAHDSPRLLCLNHAPVAFGFWLELCASAAPGGRREDAR